MTESHATFHELPLTAIRPEGWLRRALEMQRDGLTGHIEVAGYPYDTCGWAGAKVPPRAGGGVETWWPYEQVAYWVDGALRCGYLLGDAGLIERAGRQVDYVLAHQGSDGYLGPKHLRRYGWQFRWSHNVFFRAMMARHQATGDPAIPEALRRHYLSRTSNHDEPRDSANIETICWAYAHTGDERLLTHAVEAFESFNRRYPDTDNSLKSIRSDKVAIEHGVTYNELAKLPAILYMHTGKRSWLRAALRAYEKIDRNHLLITGVNSSAEHLTTRTEMDAQETCDTADYTWSVGYLLQADGDVLHADRIERAIFNAAFGAFRSDFKALQYFSGPNQAIAARNSDHSPMTRGGKWMSYRPKPGTECCTGQFNRILPNYVARMYLSDGSGGLAAACYAPSRVTARLGHEAREVTVVQETQYPFGDEVSFQVRTDAPVAFPLHLRIPRWCRGATVAVNGQPWRGKVRPGRFITLDRTFAHNDRVTLRLDAPVERVDWPTGGVALRRGPLVYSLAIEERWTRDRRERFATDEFPAWNCTPASEFNYALAVDPDDAARDVEIVRREPTLEPWSPEGAPICLRVPARKVAGWSLRKLKSVMKGNPDHQTPRRVKGDFLLTPPLPEPDSVSKRLAKRVQTVTFLPLGCTHLRMTILPDGH